MSLVVSKFGGTSMGDADCMMRSAEVSLSRKAYLTCVSATSGTTNALIKLAELAEKSQKNETYDLLNSLKERHLKIAHDLYCCDEKIKQIENLLTELSLILEGLILLKDCSLRVMDLIMSFGERLSSVLFCQALENQMQKLKLNFKVQFLDARDVILTDDRFGQGRPQIIEIEKLCKEKILQKFDPDHYKIVTQGFLGATRDGHTTTLGRGGSDYSAALFAEGLSASLLEIWTDVPGLATTDPRICKNARSIHEISFKEASEMAIFGAKVLHPSTVEPAIRKNIPVFVGSSFDASLGGTWIKKDVPQNNTLRAIAFRRRQTLITLSTPDMLQTHGFLFKIFKVFNDHQISIDVVTTSEISVSLTIDGDVSKLQLVIQALKEFAEVSVESGLSLVSLIGQNLQMNPNLTQKIFSSLEGIKIRLICWGASQYNFCFLVSDSENDHVVTQLHQNLIMQSI